MEKIIEMHPAFDKRNPDPNKNYGVHGVEMRFVLKGKDGAVQFLLYSNWQLPHVTKEFRKKMSSENYFMFEPMPADLGYHSIKPHYDGQESVTKECTYLDGKPCFYDGSGLNAERVYETFLRQGLEGIWKELEDYYKEVFNT